MYGNFFLLEGGRLIMMHRLAISIMAVLLVAGLAACNTIQGLGKDIEKGGEAIQKSVK
jgi:entericidin B